MIVLCLTVSVYAWFVLHQKHQTGLSSAFIQYILQYLLDVYAFRI